MKFIIATILVLFNISAFAQLNDFAELVDSSDLRKHISILASDSLEGRESGLKGQKLAAKYIQEFYKSCKLTQCDSNEYLQKFSFLESSPKKVELIFNNETIPNFNQIVYEGKLCTEKSENEIVFVGEGSKSELNGIDLNNKILLLFTRKYLNKLLLLKDSLKYHSILYVPYYSEEKFNSQLEINKTFFYLSQKRPVGFKDISAFSSTINNMNNEREIIFSISPKLAEKILDMPIDTIKQIIISNQKNKSLSNLKTIKNKTIKYNIEISVNYYDTENVIGMLQSNLGSDKYLIITAHYDHLGKKGDNIFHGADDNASGVSAMLEIIQSLTFAKHSGYDIPINIVFIATSAEELGLWGSTYYTKKPLYPLNKTIADINLDMLGRIDPDVDTPNNYLYVFQVPEMSNQISQYFKSSSDIEIIMINQSISDYNICISDQYSFLVKNIPNIFITSGTHPDYHKTSDTSDKINYYLLEKRTKLIVKSIFELITNK